MQTDSRHHSRVERTALVLAVIGGLFSCGCDAQATRLLTITTPEQVVACGGELPAQEEFIRDVFEFFEEPVPDDLALTLRVVDEEALAQEAVCGAPYELAGCARGTTAWSRQSFADRHELVHLVMNQLAGSGIPVLSEGIADALGYGPNVANLAFTPQPLARLLTTPYSEFRHEQRGAAALFVHYLLRRISPSDFLELYRRLPQGSGIAPVDEAFREIVGLSVEEADAEWRSGQQCAHQFLACDADADLDLSPPFRIEHLTDCSAGETRGYDDRRRSSTASRRPYHVHSIEIVEGGAYIAEFVGGSGSMLLCDSYCTDAPASDFRFYGSWWSSEPGDVYRVELDLKPGIYRFVAQGDDTSNAFSFALRSADQ